MRIARSIISLVAIMAVFYAPAADRPPFNDKLQPEAECEVPVNILHPTQFSVGWREVHMRSSKLAQLKPAKLAKYLEEHIVPIVIGPKGVPFILDYHHLIAALIESGIRKSVPARVVDNLAHATENEFWKQMRERQRVHPYDEHGNGPLSVILLPAHVKELKDDPWRSLACAVREAGGYEKHDEIAYADFKWADFFRANVPFENTDAGFAAAVHKGIEAARSPAAGNLPGYLGKVP